MSTKKWVDVAGTPDGIRHGKKLVEDADRKAQEIYGCRQWLFEGVGTEVRSPVRDSFVEVLVGAAALAQANPVTLRVLGVHPESGADVYVLTLQQPAAIVERWFLERLHVSERDAMLVGQGVMMEAVSLALERAMLDKALSRNGAETEH